jgi:hypothetical protein
MMTRGLRLFFRSPTYGVHPWRLTQKPNPMPMIYITEPFLLFLLLYIQTSPMLSVGNALVHRGSPTASMAKAKPHTMLYRLLHLMKSYHMQVTKPLWPSSVYVPKLKLCSRQHASIRYYPSDYIHRASHLFNWKRFQANAADVG